MTSYILVDSYNLYIQQVCSVVDLCLNYAIHYGPQNGFWWSLGFCSILFIPVIIFSVITSTCYLRKKSDEQIDSYTDYP